MSTYFDVGYSNLRGVFGGDVIFLSITRDQAKMGESLSTGPGAVVTNTNADSTLDTWYNVQAIMDGDHVEVWRAGLGEDPERILEGQMATIMAGQAVGLIAKPNCYATVDDYTFATADPGEYVARYNDANEMTMSADATGRTAYTYDAWGRTVTKTYMADPANTYTATCLSVRHRNGVPGDAADAGRVRDRFGDKLKRYDTNLPGEETGIYNYDGLGKRRLKLVDDDYTWFRWAGWSILSEYGEGTDPNTLWDIAATPDKVYTPGLAERTSSSDYAYYLQDHLGSTRQVLDGTQALLARLDYTPYGEPDAWAGALPSMTYTGHYWDQETGMYFAPFRYLMPGQGRWLTQDPIGLADGPNRYGYVRGNPILGRDVLGLQYTCGIRSVMPPGQGGRKGKRAKPEHVALFVGAIIVGVLALIYLPSILSGTPDLDGEKLDPGIEPSHEAKDMKKYIDEHDGETPPGYRKPQVFENRDGTLAGDGPFEKYDVNKKKPNHPRDSERIVRNLDTGEWFYTPDHYKHFCPME